MRNWFKNNFHLLVVMACVSLGVVMVHAFVPPFPQSSMAKFPTMVWVGTAFGWLGFRFMIATERKVKHKLK